MSMEIPRWKKMIPLATSKVHSQQVRGQQLCWKDLGWCHPVPHPYYAWDYVQTTRWPRASEGRPHPVFSCLTGGIKEGSELPRVRTRGHRHKPARGKFLLEVRKDFSPWGCSMCSGCPERLLSLPGIGEMQNWNGQSPEQTGLPPPALSWGLDKRMSSRPFRAQLLCDTILYFCGWAQENSLSVHQVISI